MGLGRSGIGRGEPSRGYSWPEHRASRCSDPSVATGLAEHAGGGGVVTPLRKVANGHGGLWAPESQLPQKGTRVAPQYIPMGGMTQTAALQLPSHLGEDVPMSRRTSRMGLVDALSAHYGSPGRLADYRWQFEKTTRSAGEDPSIFAIALETLAVKAFGDMGQTARLRLIRERFIAGHNSCELRRYLDSVPPETPI